MNRSIRRCYGLRFAEGSIITRNLGAQDKAKVLRTAVEFFSKNCMPKEWRDNADKVIKDINKLIPDRNTVAHTAFKADHKGDVRLLRVLAVHTFSEQSVTWTRSQIEEKCQEMDKVCDALRHLSYELRQRRRSLREAAH